MAQLNANDNTWSAIGETEEDALGYVEGLNFCLSHPELNSPEKIDEWFARQADNEEGEDDE